MIHFRLFFQRDQRSTSGHLLDEGEGDDHGEGERRDDHVLAGIQGQPESTSTS